MLRRLASNLSHALVAAAALAALALSVVAIVKLRDGGSVEVRTAGSVADDLEQVVARARGTAKVVAEPSPNVERPGPGAPYPLSGNRWTQGVRESNQFIGQAVYRGRCDEIPSDPGEPGGGFSGEAALIEFFVDGNRAARTTLANTRRRDKSVIAFEADAINSSGGAVLFERGERGRRTLTATVADLCQDGSPVVVESLKVNVLGFK